jgi:hypothetical protein
MMGCTGILIGIMDTGISGLTEHRIAMVMQFHLDTSTLITGCTDQHQDLEHLHKGHLTITEDTSTIFLTDHLEDSEVLSTGIQE